MSFDDLLASVPAPGRGPHRRRASTRHPHRDPADILQVKCAVLAVHRSSRERGVEVPVLVQVTVETTGTLLVGTDTAAALVVLESLPVDVVGLNRATGLTWMAEHVRYLAPARAWSRSSQRRPAAERRRPAVLPLHPGRAGQAPPLRRGVGASLAGMLHHAGAHQGDRRKPWRV